MVSELELSHPPAKVGPSHGREMEVAVVVMVEALLDMTHIDSLVEDDHSTQETSVTSAVKVDTMHTTVEKDMEVEAVDEGQGEYFILTNLFCCLVLLMP